MTKKFGVKMTLPVGDTMRAEHLLGESFKAERWFESNDARQEFLENYQKEFVYFRKGDKARFDYELIN